MKYLIIVSAAASLITCSNGADGSGSRTNDSSADVVAEVSVANYANNVRMDSVAYGSQIEGIVSEAYTFIDFNKIGRGSIKCDAGRTDFDFCGFRKSTTGISFTVCYDSLNRVSMIKQIATAPDYLQCNYYVYYSIKNPRFLVLFMEEVDGTGNRVRLDGCIVQDLLLNKSMYLRWTQEGQCNFKNLLAIMLLDCQTFEVKSYLRYKSGDVKYFARIEKRNGVLTKDCYVQEDKTILIKMEMNQLYSQLEKVPHDSIRYVSLPISVLDGEVNYPLWYNNAYALLADDAGHLPLYYGK